MSIIFDDDKNWRKATDEESELIVSWASEQHKVIKGTFIGLSVIVLFPLVLLTFVYLVDPEGGNLPLLIMLTILGLSYLGWEFHKLKRFPGLVRNNAYEVQKGKIVSRTRKRYRWSSLRYLIFENDYGNRVEVFVERNEYFAISDGTPCIIVKVEPKGPGYKDEIGVIPLTEEDT